METVHGHAGDHDAFTLTTEDAGDGEVVARVAGTLDSAHGPALHQALLGALRQAPERLVVDLSGVSFFGSAGVTALVWLSQHPEAAGKRVRVVATSRVVTGPLELTGLLQRLDVSGMPVESRPPEDPTGPAVPPSV
ncbi:STAS domain-containing protein [Klenkia terrae]|nr:STAS domain-containing protein [Klenkia terrae]